jgi:hypothetical protein
MAIAHFTFDEMVYNSIVNGKQIYYNEILYTIDYVKLVKNTRQVLIVTTSGDSFIVNQDDVFTFEVNTPKPMVTPNKSKLKGNNT